MVVLVQLGVFAVWLVCLLVAARKKKALISQMDECKDVDRLRLHTHTKLSTTTGNDTPGDHPAPAPTSDSLFDQYCEYKVPQSSPLYDHLKAIFNAGYTESQVQIDALLGNTSRRLAKSDPWLRSVLSLFIILGLLGTLLGLAESLSQLSAVSLGNAESSNESLKKGLEILLGKLGGAFAPSIYGVLLTVIGMLIFAAYQRWSTYPVLQRLEYETLTRWLPALIPTPSQRVYEKLRLTEETAQNVERLVETVHTNTGELSKNIQSANAALQHLNGAAQDVGSACYGLTSFTHDFTQDLNKFSTRFQRGVEILAPFGESLERLYGQMTEESSQFQLSVRQTLEDSQNFRRQIKEEFDRQSGQARLLLESLKLYETAYLESRQTTDERLNQTLTAAESALLSIERQNHVLVRSLVQAVGDPLREELMRELGTISTKSNEKLGEVTASTNTKLAELSKEVKEALLAVSLSVDSVANKLATLETPIKGTAESIATTARNTTISMDATLTNFDSRTQSWLSALRQEFQSQNNHQESQLNSLASLNSNIGSLISEMRGLGAKIENFANKPVYRTPTNGVDTFPPARRKTLLGRLKFWD